ncbi:MAG TPA: DUF4262 domain-containing protein [Planctomycetota bacterium]|nr:DUF4262 domain-containing protein [Planctomycetota bacterium]
MAKASAEPVEVRVELEDGDEVFWAIPLGDDRYRVDNFLACAAHIAPGDVVRCERKKGEKVPVVAEVVERGPFCAVGLVFDEDFVGEDLAGVVEAGLGMEVAPRGAAPRTPDAKSVESALKAFFKTKVGGIVAAFHALGCEPHFLAPTMMGLSVPRDSFDEVARILEAAPMSVGWDVLSGPDAPTPFAGPFDPEEEEEELEDEPPEPGTGVFAPFADFDMTVEELSLLQRERDTDRAGNLERRMDHFVDQRPDLAMRKLGFVPNIMKNGFTCVGVPGEGESSDLAFSVGFFYSYGHPELMLVGASVVAMQKVIEAIGQEIKRGGEQVVGPRDKKKLTENATRLVETLQKTLASQKLEAKKIAMPDEAFLEEYAYGYGWYFYRHFLDDANVPLLMARLA